MHIYKRPAAALLGLALWLSCAPAPETSTPAEAEASSDRLDWFKEAKFGMFIHWGPYSSLGGEWDGKRLELDQIAEWIMHTFQIPVADYRELAREFNPVEFDAEKIAQLALDTGMKYVVFTSKHHDGFAMYDSTVSDYNIVDWTPYDRDPIRDLAEACRRRGLKFGLYYSHREDWNEPSAYGNTWDFDFDPEQDLETFEREYLDVKAKPQLRELFSNYGEISVAWFDRGIYTPEQANQFVEIIRELQPGCVINGRIGSYGQELLGDYQSTSDNLMPPGGIEEYWETPQTLNHTWGFSKFDTEWKTGEEVVRRLVDIVSKGGNYLLNIGPDGLGRVPQATLDTFAEVGPWVQAHGESIYGATASPFPELPWGTSTVKGSKLYLHVFDWPNDGKLVLEGLRSNVRRAYPLLEPDAEYSVEQSGSELAVAIPSEALDAIDSVIVLEIEGAPEVEPAVVTRDDDGAIVLDYYEAVTAGEAVKRFNRKGLFHISKWREPVDEALWHVDVADPGRYRVSIEYAANPEWEGQSFVVATESAELTGNVVSTAGSAGSEEVEEDAMGKCGGQCIGSEYEYQAFELGEVELTAGEQLVRIHPAGSVPENLMHFKAVRFTPSE